MSAPTDGLIGASVRRVEDAALVSGRGHYVDDFHPAGLLYLGLLRSPYPKAKVLSIDVTAAKAMPGVVAVLVGDDLPEHLKISTPPMVPGMRVPAHPVLARGTVHAVGTPVAAVVAESPAIARDATNNIQVEYEGLPSIADVDAALLPDAVLAHDELGTNVCFTLKREGGDVDQAFATADHIARLHIDSPRQVAVAIEPRSILAVPNIADGGLTVWLASQGVHRVRADLANTLRVPENKLRLIAPDVGGGFGSKSPLYREDVLTCYMALTLDRPVKWISTRSEDFLTTIQGRDQSMRSELALRKDGTMIGLKVHVIANLGGYLQSSTAGPPQRMMSMALGCYQIPNVRVEVTAVLTNTVPTGPYRGAGRPEAVLNIERLADQAARDLGIDRLELRRKNFIQPDQFPYKNALGVEYDSGDYEKALSEALRLADYDGLLKRRAAIRKAGGLAGIGFSTFVEPSGGAGFESGSLRVERTGVFTVLTGSSAHGQGHETVFAQIVADRMKVQMEQVSVVHGDTSMVQQGTGSFGSRSAIMGGGALALAVDRVLEKARKIAAHMLEAAPEDMIQVEHGFSVAGTTDRTVTWQQIAATAYGAASLPAGVERGLQETAFFDPKRESWGFGTHIAFVTVDRDTGTPTIEKLVLVDDSGVLLNPMIVEGQIHGGVAQGLGEALREHMLFDETGQIVTGSLMDYAMMRAGDMPELILGETCTPNPNSSLGVKGVGEAGTNGAPPAVANALMDALEPLGIGHINMPFTAPKLWSAIHQAEATPKSSN